MELVPGMNNLTSDVNVMQPTIAMEENFTNVASNVLNSTYSTENLTNNSFIEFMNASANISDYEFAPAEYFNDSIYWMLKNATNGSGTGYDNSTNTTDVVPRGVEKGYWAITLLFLPVLTVFGNILVILSVYKEKSLQTATNYFIVSLAFADLLVALTVMPFAVYMMVNVDWDLSETACDMYIAVDVTCSTASIFNLVAISIDRFIAVTRPLKYSKHKGNINRVRITIAVVWVISAVIASPIVLGLNSTPARDPKICIFYNSDFIIYSSLGSFYIPCIVMLFLYYKIFRAIRQRTKKSAAIKKPKIDQIKPNTVIENTKEITKLQEEEIVLTLNPTGGFRDTSDVEMVVPSCEVLRGSDEDEIDDEESGSNKNSKNIESCHIIRNKSPIAVEIQKKTEEVKQRNIVKKTYNGHGKSTNDNGIPAGQTLEPLTETNQMSRSSNSSQAVSVPAVIEKKKKSRFAFSMVHKSSRKKKREKTAARRERKATKTLAIVLGIFLLCWVPFFTCNVINAIFMKLGIKVFQDNMELFLATTWLGYINSCLNPLIYTIFNIEFRKSFKKLLQEPCR